jgi:hypothetical protein
MATSYITIVIGLESDSISQSNQQLFQQDAAGNVVNDAYDGLTALINHIDATNGGTKHPCTVQVTTRDTDPGVTTSGAHSAQVTYNRF